MLMVENNHLTENDVLFMQFICKQTGCRELYERCANYALTQKMLCFFESGTGIFFIILPVLETLQIYFITRFSFINNLYRIIIVHSLQIILKIVYEYIMTHNIVIYIVLYK